MKKPKLSFGEGGFKGFMARHCEKIAVGVVGIIGLVLIYFGATVDGIDDSKTPTALQNEVNTARAAMDRPTWEFVQKHREPPGDYASRVQGQRVPTQEELYPIPMAWDRPHFQASQKRGDPEIYPPTKPQAVGIVGALAVRATEQQPDPILEASVKAMEQRALAEGDGDDSGEDGLLAPIRGGGEGLGGDFGRMLTQEVPGYRPTGGAQSVIAESANVIVITALVPHRKLFEEYERVFVGADDFQAGRDRPQYRRIWVERAEVPSSGLVPDPEKLKWYPIILNSQRFKTFDGPPAEMAAANYVDPMLTAPPIPLMMQELESLMVPSEIPKQTDMLAETGGLAEADEPTETDDGSGDLFGANPLGGNNGLDGPGLEGGNVRRPTNPGQNYVNEGGRGGGGVIGVGEARASEAAKYKLVRYYDFTAQPGKKYVYRCRFEIIDPNDPPADMTVSVTPRGGEGGSGSSSAPAARFLSNEVAQRIANKNNDVAQTYLQRALKYKDTNLDLAVKLYKAAALLKPKNTEPSLQNVAEQLTQKLEAANYDATALAVNTSTKFDVNWRESDWSEISDPVSLPTPGKMLAGQVTQPGPTDKLQEPKGKVVAVVWDRSLAVEVPAEMEVHRGSVLNEKTEVEVLHPVTLQITNIGEKPVDTNAIVLDLKGGTEVVPSTYVGGRRREGVAGLGEVLISDANGNLIVRDQYSDVADYRRYMFIEDSEGESTLDVPGADLLENGPDFQGGFEGLIPIEGGNPPRGRGRTGGRDRTGG